MGMFIYAKLIIVFTPNIESSPGSEVIHGSTTFKLTKGKHRLKKSDQLYWTKLMFLIFLLLSSLQCSISVINRSVAWYIFQLSN